MLYYAVRLNGNGTESLIASNLPLSDVTLSPSPLSAPSEFTWTITPEYRMLQGADGAPVFLPWSTAIYALDDEAGVIRGAGILKSLKPKGATLTGEMVGWSAFLEGTPWTWTTVKRYGADPGELIALIWSRVQSEPRGNIGLSVPAVDTRASVGSRTTKTTPDPAPKTTTKVTTTTTEVTTVTTRIEKTLDPSGNTVTTTVTTAVKDRKTGKTTTTKRVTVRRQDAKTLAQTTTVREYDAAGKLTDTKTTTTTLAKGTTVDKQETTVENDEPFLLANYATENLGTVIQELMTVGSIEYRERHTLRADGTVAHALDMGYPRLGRRRTDIAFNVGVNVAEVPETVLDAEDYASEVLLLGAGDGDKMVRAHAVNPDAARLRRVAVVKSPGIGRQNTANVYAAKTLQRLNAFPVDVDQLVIVDSPLAPLMSWESGDEIRLTGDTGWGGHVDMWVRVLGTDYSPDKSANTATVDVVRADKV